MADVHTTDLSGAAAPIRVAVVGLGYWGPNLVRNLAESPLFDVTQVCDLRPGTIEAIQSRYPGISGTTRFEEVLRSDDVDAVAIATPVSTHHPLAMSALEAGKHTFVEKPLAGSSEQVLELIELAQKNNLVLMPGHTFLYSPSVTTIKNLIDSGELGEIYFISSSRVNLGLHQPDVSVVWDLAPHDFSILRYWLGMRPSEVSALSRSCLLPDVPDVCFINLKYPSGTVAHVELSWLSPSKLRRTAIVGSKKMVVYDDTSNESVRIFDSGATLPDPETFGEYRLSYRTGDIVSPRVEATEPLSLELADFATSIRQGSALVSSPEVGLDVVRTVEAVDRSLVEGGVPVPVLPPAEPITEILETRIEELKPDTREKPPSASENSRGSIGTAILGGGPAGLTAAHIIGRRGRPATVFEADGSVGGIAKTIEFNGYRFDLGGHRFFTKLGPVQRLWEEMLGSEFLTRPRLSRIYYDGKYFAYPITAKDVVGRLGLVESTRCALSYLWAARHRRPDADTFEEWVTSRFGRRLYDAFFRSYTEKVWGIPGSEIRSLWAAQRIKNFSLGKAMLSVLGLSREHVTTLIEEFHYPRLGPGQMWETFASRAREAGTDIRLNQRCVSLKHSDGVVRSVVMRQNGHIFEHAVESVISSIPLSDLVLSLDPPAPLHAQQAAKKLRYRDLVLVALMTTEDEPFPDNWIYLHDPETRAGRVQNYGAWSADMVRPGTTCLGVEYFCFQGDEIWEMSDKEAVEMATTELARIGLLDPNKVFDGVKVLVPRAYPVYDSHFEEAVATLRIYLQQFKNLQTCGRNGLHRYNNQDHSMWTAILAALNVIDGAGHDVWSVNTEADYLEEGELVEALLEFSAADAAPVERVA
ncbi:MAG: Gfo/Idh/MocA family oxidoreductase [Actinomycetota bacterium]|nr:Gfo/Idh/MocA family oxidoreductase [Actinomycetota bacterium]MDP9303381.1 Gfo/Idh/MocA family oxidoreductase [Actinomycetota bacterium]